MFDLIELSYFVFLGAVGAVAYILIKSDDWEDLTTYDAFKRLSLGIISGGIYQLLYSNYDFPNSLMAIVSGYTGTDFILSLMNKLKPIKREIE